MIGESINLEHLKTKKKSLSVIQYQQTPRQVSLGLSKNTKAGVLIKSIELMKEGILIKKYGKQGKPHPRVFKIDENQGTLYYVSRKKKTRGESQILFTEIKGLSRGSNHKLFKRVMKKKTLRERHACCFTLYYGTGKELCVECKSQEDVKMWLTCIGFMHEKFNIARNSDPTRIKILEMWVKGDEDGNGLFDFKEAVSLCRLLGITCSEKLIRSRFDKADEDGSNGLEFPEFVTFYKDLMKHTAVDKIFDAFRAKESQLLTTKQMKEFFMKCQKEDLTGEEINEILKSNGGLVIPSMINTWGMTRFDFFRFLFSSANGIVFPSYYTVYQNMKKPLSHYWIASSHNTYLTGHQLHGKSSCKMYEKALAMNCKCVELDCWDGKNGEPMITHGRTLTTKIKFKDVLNVIAKLAFRKGAPNYPLTLSLEVHCGKEQQDKMAKYIREIFKETLEPQWNNIEDLPSPESLRGKIIVKGKRLPKEGEEEEEWEDEDLMSVIEAIDEDSPQEEESKKKKKHKVKVFPELSSVATIHAVKFFEFIDSEGSWQMHSFNESKIGKIMKKQMYKLSAYNQRQIARIYPKGTRIKSSNYDPIVHWNVGSQMVSLNYQTMDLHLQLHQLRFLQNGSCGYILKPDILMDKKRVFIPSDYNIQTNVMQIRILGGSLLPKECINPFVKVNVILANNDVQTFQTKPVYGNGFNPLWNEGKDFKLVSKQLDLIHFQVYNRGMLETLICQTLFPISEIRTGYRSVPLYNLQSELIEESSLLVKIEFKHSG